MEAFLPMDVALPPVSSKSADESTFLKKLKMGELLLERMGDRSLSLVTGVSWKEEADFM